jgi:hypothetical protein
MLAIKINKKDYKMLEIEDITFDVFLKFDQCKTAKDQLDLLLNTDTSDIPDSCAKEIEKILGLIDGIEANIMEFISGCGNPEEHIEVKIFDQVIKFNKDLGKLAYWPMTKVKAMIKAMGNEPFNKYDHYKSFVGHYLFAKIGTYDEYLAEQFCDDVVSTMPFKTVLSLGDFFLYMQRHLWMPKRECSHLNRMITKKQRELQNLRNTGS